MPIPDHAYRHVPELRGRITEPETSFFRDMAQRIRDFDAKAEAEGRDLGWRLTHAVREDTRRAALIGREGRPVWVFGYGSLIWDPAVVVDEIRRGVLEGHRRSFCFLLDGGRGSPEAPGLMAALDEHPGHRCEGVVMRIPPDLVEQETERMWMREMITGIYRPRWFEIATPQGPVEAVTFLADPEHHRYVGDMPRAERARLIAVAEGVLGSNREYLENLLSQLDALGLEDPEMSELHAMVLDARAR